LQPLERSGKADGRESSYEPGDLPADGVLISDGVCRASRAHTGRVPASAARFSLLVQNET